MRIRHIVFHGIRGLDGLKKDLPRSSSADLTVVYGRYRSGKTTLLDALAAAKEAVGEYGSPESRWSGLVGPVGVAKVQLDWELSAAEQTRMAFGHSLVSTESILGKPTPSDAPAALVGILSHAGDSERGSVHYLHDTRDLDGPLSFGADDASLRNRLTTRNSKFADLYDLLDQPSRGPARNLASARLTELCPGLEIAGLRRVGTGFTIMLLDRRTNEERPFETLSRSERQAFLVALYASRAPIVDSVVLLDSPEIGFGDGAVELIRALLRWTTQTQLIVATSLHVVRSMPEVSNVVELASS